MFKTFSDITQVVGPDKLGENGTLLLATASPVLNTHGLNTDENFPELFDVFLVSAGKGERLQMELVQKNAPISSVQKNRIDDPAVPLAIVSCVYEPSDNS